jgi:outer membrane protein
METTMTTLNRIVLALALAHVAVPAAAQARGDWAFTLGAHQVNPKSDNGSLAGGALPLDVGSDAKPTVTAEYFIRDNLGIEVLAAWPFEHDIAVDGVGRVASAKHLPPTVSLQYHFNSGGTVSPFVGAGLNYTAFFSEDTTGALAGSDLSLDDSWGVAAHAGIDFAIGERGAIRIDMRWIDIDSDVEVDGADLGTAHIDPLVYGVAWRFGF